MNSIRWDSDPYYQDRDNPDETKESFLASLRARHERAVARGELMIAPLPRVD